LPVIGQVGLDVGLQRALESGQQIEHLDQYLEALMDEDVDPASGLSGIGVWTLGNWPGIEDLDAGPASFLNQGGAGRTEYAPVDSPGIHFETVITSDVGFGRIAVGKRADMVLLGASPLDDIRNTTLIEGVVLRGRWLPRDELDEILQRLPKCSRGHPSCPHGRRPEKSAEVGEGAEQLVARLRPAHQPETPQRQARIVVDGALQRSSQQSHEASRGQVAVLRAQQRQFQGP